MLLMSTAVVNNSNTINAWPSLKSANLNSGLAGIHVFEELDEQYYFRRHSMDDFPNQMIEDPIRCIV